MAASDARARGLGFETPASTDLIRNGDNAISKNARAAVDLFDQSIGAISNLSARGETLPIGSALAVTMSGPLSQKVINIGIPRAIQASNVPGLLDYAGAGTAAVTMLHENFNRTAADLVGTSPQIGNPWTGNAARWSANGSVASASAGGALVSDVGQKEATVTATLRVVTTGTGSNQLYRIYAAAASSVTAAGLWAGITITPTGTLIAVLWQTVGSTSTNLGTCAIDANANSATPQTVTVVLSLVGTTATLDCGSGATTATLTSGDVAGLSTRVGVYAGSSVTSGFTVDSIIATRPRVASDDPGAPRIVTADATGTLPDVVLDSLDDRYGISAASQTSALEPLRTLRAFTAGYVTVAVVSDSTANDRSDWFRVWARKWGETFPASTRRTYNDWDNAAGAWRVTTVDAAGTGGGTLDIWNGAIAGGKLSTFDAAKRAAQFGTLTPDVLVLAMGHNHAAQTPEAFLDELAAWLAAWKLEHPGCAVVISSQNTEVAPAVNRDAHRARQAALRIWAKTNGYDYVPVFEAFNALPDQGASLIIADGIHPTTPPGSDTTGAYGAVLWTDTLLDTLTS